MLALLAQQEVELTTMKETILTYAGQFKICMYVLISINMSLICITEIGSDALEYAMEKAKKVAKIKYGTYIEFRQGGRMLDRY